MRSGVFGNEDASKEFSRGAHFEWADGNCHRNVVEVSGVLSALESISTAIEITAQVVADRSVDLRKMCILSY